MKDIVLRNALLTHLDALVSFRSTSDKPEEIGKCIDYFIDAVSQFSPFVTSEMFIHNGVISYIALTHPTKCPRVLLYAHVDVVPAKTKDGKEIDGMFVLRQSPDGYTAYGRGVFDMKFAVAVYIEVLRKLVQNGIPLTSLGVFLTSDEEEGGFNGTRYLLHEKGYRADLVIMPDGGNDLRIVSESKGLLRAVITASGATAHASRPWKGVNAIDKINRVINVLTRYRRRKIRQTAQLSSTSNKLFQDEVYPHINSNETSEADEAYWFTTVNFSRLTGGITTELNQISDAAELVLDIRYIHADDPKTELTRLFEKKPILTDTDITLSFGTQKAAFFVDRENNYIQIWKQLVEKHKKHDNLFMREAGTGDHHHFSELGIPVIVSQPRGNHAHSEREEISIDSLMEYCEILYDFICKLH